MQKAVRLFCLMVIASGGFLIAHSVKAADLYSITAPSTNNCTLQDSSSVACQQAGGTAGAATWVGFATSTSFGATSTQAIGQVRLLLGLANPLNSTDLASNCRADVEIMDENGTTYDAATTVPYTNLSVGTLTPTEFKFYTSSTINLSLHKLSVITITASGTISPYCTDDPVVMAMVTPSPDSNVMLRTQSNTTFDTVPVFVITDQYSADLIPNQTQLKSSCSASSWVVAGVDFGQGLCNAMNFIFVPDQSALQNWTNTQALMETKAPFSYLYELGTDFSGLATTTTSTMSGLTLSAGSTSTPFYVAWDAFSTSTIAKYTNSTLLTTLRTLMQWALYLAFITMVIYEVRKIFAKPKA